MYNALVCSYQELPLTVLEKMITRKCMSIFNLFIKLLFNVHKPNTSVPYSGYLSLVQIFVL